MLKCVNVQELTDGILLRLFLVSSHFAQDQRPDEATDWRHIAYPQSVGVSPRPPAEPIGPRRRCRYQDPAENRFPNPDD